MILLKRERVYKPKFLLPSNKITRENRVGCTTNSAFFYFGIRPCSEDKGRTQGANGITGIGSCTIGGIGRVEWNGGVSLPSPLRSPQDTLASRGSYFTTSRSHLWLCRLNTYLFMQFQIPQTSYQVSGLSGIHSWPEGERAKTSP